MMFSFSLFAPTFFLAFALLKLLWVVALVPHFVMAQSLSIHL